MDDILLAGTNLQWTEVCKTIEEIESITFPQIVKVTPETAEAYNLPEKEPVLLFGRKKLIRIIAQTLEEGDYVMGKQVEIPQEFSGYFKLSHDFDREEIQLKRFTTVQEVADYFPPKVYVQQDINVMAPPSQDKSLPVPLIAGDELTLISRSDVPSVISSAAKPASRFINRVIPKLNQQTVLIVHCTRMNESISLPLNLDGHFATRSPFDINQSMQSRELTVFDLIENINFPVAVLVALNQSRSPKDEFVLRPGLHLKLVGVEFHDVVLAVTPFQRITEFAATRATFFLPQALVNAQANEKDTTSYHTYKQKAYLNTQLQGSVSNIDNYTKSVRFYVSRNTRPTKPQALPPLAVERIKMIDPSLLNQHKRERGMSAIALISRGVDPLFSPPRTGARSTSLLRRSLPTPGLQPAVSDGPPLPPRNSGGKLPPVPRKERPPSILFSESELPQREPPIPNGVNSSPINTPKEQDSYATRGGKDALSLLTAPSRETNSMDREMNDYGENKSAKSDEIWDDITNRNSFLSSSTPSSDDLENTATVQTNQDIDKHPQESVDLLGFGSNTSINSMLTDDENKNKFILKQLLQEKKYILPDENWTPSHEISQMTVQQITLSLRYIGFSEEVVQVFSNERVDGSLFVELSNEMLEQDFYLSKFYIFKIRKFISGWRPKTNPLIYI